MRHSTLTVGVFFFAAKNVKFVAIKVEGLVYIFTTCSAMINTREELVTKENTYDEDKIFDRK
jgi:hypothetical protein